MSRRLLPLPARAILAALLATPIVQVVPAAAAPAFKLPLECNQTYVGSTHAGHNGQAAIDFNQASNADRNDEVLASAAGKVVGILGSNGQITIDHGSGWRTTYAHMTNIDVTINESVVQGELLGFIGAVGDASGDHLHYQQEYNGSVVQSRFDGLLYTYGTSAKSTLCLNPPVTDSFDSTFYGDIRWLYQNAYTSGCDTIRYCPSGSVTRGQMAAFLDRLLALPATSGDYFTDDNGHVFEASINRVAAAGITSGCTLTTYCPEGLITRGQMAAFLDRALGLPTTSVDYFTDDETSPFEASINRAAAAGLTSGCTPTTFCPGGTVSRGQMAAFMHRAHDYRN